MTAEAAGRGSHVQLKAEARAAPLSSNPKPSDGLWGTGETQIESQIDENIYKTTQNVLETVPLYDYTYLWITIEVVAATCDRRSFVPSPRWDLRRSVTAPGGLEVEDQAQPPQLCHRLPELRPRRVASGVASGIRVRPKRDGRRALGKEEGNGWEWILKYPWLSMVFVGSFPYSLQSHQ